MYCSIDFGCRNVTFDAHKILFVNVCFWHTPRVDNFHSSCTNFPIYALVSKIDIEPLFVWKLMKMTVCLKMMKLKFFVCGIWRSTMVLWHKQIFCMETRIRSGCISKKLKSLSPFARFKTWLLSIFFRNPAAADLFLHTKKIWLYSVTIAIFRYKYQNG